MKKEDSPHWRTFVLALKEVAKQQGKTDEEIANLAGINRATVNRLFNLRFIPKLDTFLAVCKALELNIFFETRDSKTELNIAFEKAMEELGRRQDKLPKN